MGTKKKSQSKKVLPKTQRSKILPKEIKQSSLKQPLSMCLISVSPYDGIPIYTIEKDVLKHVVLLNDLRILFKKQLFDIAIFTEQSNPIELERLSIICPEHYKNIFVKERLTLNIELLKNTYPKYYNFISTFNPNIITVEEFKEQYSEILSLLNSNIGHLISMNEKIKVYNSKEGTFSDDVIKAVTSNIERLKNKSSKPTNPEPEKVKTNDILNVEIDKEELKAAKPHVDRFIWHKSKEALEYLFEELFENQKINQVKKVSLPQHFILSTENIKFLPENFKKINWKEDLTELAYVIDYLLNLNIISKQGRGIHILTIKHFTYLGEDIKKGSLTQSLSAVKKLNPKPHNYVELKNMIDRLP